MNNIKSLKYIEIAETIKRFLDGTVDPYEWDELLSLRNSGVEEVDQLLHILRDISITFPPTIKGHYCSTEGRKFLLSVSEIIIRQDWQWIEIVDLQNEYI